MKQCLNALFNVFLKILWLLLIYLACRLLFFAFNYQYFSSVTFFDIFNVIFWGIKFDLSAIAYTNLLPFVLSILYFGNQKVQQHIISFLFVFVNSVAIAANCADFEFFKFIYKRTSYDLFITKGLSTDFITLIPEFLRDYWYVIIIWVILSSFIYLGQKRINRIAPLNAPFSFKNFVFQILFVSVFCGFSILVGRGGFQPRPMTTINAAAYVSTKYVVLAINTPFSIYTTYEQASISEPLNYMSDKDAEKLIKPIKIQTYKNEKKLNVVIIILESFSKEYIGYYNNGKGYTPYLDSLMKKSLVFTNAYSNGKKSNEGIPAILGGIPSLMNIPYINTNYGANEINSIANILKKKNYYTAFFHGGKNGTMGFDQFAKLAEFDLYYGKTEYNNDADYDGAWGIWDEPFLQRFAQETNKFKQPFLSCVFTLSSHHPFKVPDSLSKQLKKGSLPIHQSIAYTDLALKRYFDTVKKYKWFKNTLFVITADHTSTAESAFYQNRLGMFTIPIVFYHPGSLMIGTNSNVTQHIDIIPTITSYLNLRAKYFSFGNNAFASKNSGFSINYFNESYAITDKSYTLIFDGNKTTNIYEYRTDSLLNNDLKDSLRYNAKMKLLEWKLKAFLQLYNNNILKNKTIVK